MTLNSTNLSRESKLELAALLLEKERRVRENPLKYARQHAKQEEASQSTKALRVLFWGNRVGKSQWGGMECAKILLGKHPHIPEGDGWIFSPSFDEQKDTTQEKLLTYLPEKRIVDRTWLRKGILKEIVVESDTGKRNKVTFKSYEQGREKAQGAGKTFIWFDEEPPKDIFDECSVRSEAGIELHLMMTMTPIKGMTWVYTNLYLDTNNKDLFVSTATWDDNPFLTEEQKRKMAGRLTASALKVRREGKFMRQVGLVASWFDRTVHVIDMEEVPHGDYYMGIDFGFSNPAACLWALVDKEENLWIYDGFYGKGLTNPDILQEIKRREKETGLQFPITRIGDSAQASDIKEMNDAKLRIVGVKKQTGTDTENWDEWRAKLMEEMGRITEENPRGKIFISSQLMAEDDEGNAFNFLVRELENLRWEEVKTDLGIQPKSVWGKQPNHACFAAGTPIRTPEGWKAIETLRPGDYVTTPFGPSLVMEAGSTGVKPVVDFYGMKATPDHPILTPRGFVAIDALRYNDRVCVMGNPKLSWSMESGSGDTPTLQSASFGSIIAALRRRVSAERLNGFIAISGKERMVRFLKDSWFIISTIIRSTTIWRTYNSRNQSTICEITWTKRDESGRVRTCSPSFTKPQGSGMGARRATSFINGLLSRVGKISRVFPWSANNAERNSLPTSLAGRSSAEIIVAKPTSENAEVFALKTAHGMFIANGIVVSNCDALSYILATIEQTRGRGQGRILRSSGGVKKVLQAQDQFSPSKFVKAVTRETKPLWWDREVE